MVDDETRTACKDLAWWLMEVYPSFKVGAWNTKLITRFCECSRKEFVLLLADDENRTVYPISKIVRMDDDG